MSNTTVFDVFEFFGCLDGLDHELEFHSNAKKLNGLRLNGHFFSLISDNIINILRNKIIFLYVLLFHKRE